MSLSRQLRHFFHSWLCMEQNRKVRGRAALSTEPGREWEEGDTQTQRTQQEKEIKMSAAIKGARIPIECSWILQSKYCANKQHFFPEAEIFKSTHRRQNHTFPCTQMYSPPHPLPPAARSRTWESRPSLRRCSLEPVVQPAARAHDPCSHRPSARRVVVTLFRSNIFQNKVVNKRTGVELLLRPWQDSLQCWSSPAHHGNRWGHTNSWTSDSHGVSVLS